MDKQQQKYYSPVYRETNIEQNLHVLVMLNLPQNIVELCLTAFSHSYALLP